MGCAMRFIFRLHPRVLHRARALHVTGPARAAERRPGTALLEPGVHFALQLRFGDRHAFGCAGRRGTHERRGQGKAAGLTTGALRTLK